MFIYTSVYMSICVSRGFEKKGEKKGTLINYLHNKAYLNQSRKWIRKRLKIKIVIEMGPCLM